MVVRARDHITVGGRITEQLVSIMTGLDSIALEHTKNNIASYGRFLFGRIQTSKDGDQPYSDTSLYDKRSMFEPS